MIRPRHRCRSLRIQRPSRRRPSRRPQYPSTEGLPDLSSQQRHQGLAGLVKDWRPLLRAVVFVVGGVIWRVVCTVVGAVVWRVACTVVWTLGWTVWTVPGPLVWTVAGSLAGSLAGTPVSPPVPHAVARVLDGAQVERAGPVPAPARVAEVQPRVDGWLLRGQARRRVPPGAAEVHHGAAPAAQRVGDGLVARPVGARGEGRRHPLALLGRPAQVTEASGQREARDRVGAEPAVDAGADGGSRVVCASRSQFCWT